MDAASVRCCRFAALPSALYQMQILDRCVMTWFKMAYEEGWKIAMCGFGVWKEERWKAVVLVAKGWVKFVFGWISFLNKFNRLCKQ